MLRAQLAGLREAQRAVVPVLVPVGLAAGLHNAELAAELEVGHPLDENTRLKALFQTVGFGRANASAPGTGWHSTASRAFSFCAGRCGELCERLHIEHA
jgi:hypothetical protein